MRFKKISDFLNTRRGFFTLLVGLFWLKTIFVYCTDFKLGVATAYQWLVLLINPFATTILLLGLALYVRRTLLSYLTMLLIYVANTALLVFNVIYYREFTDFMTFNVIFGYSAVSNGLSTSSLALLQPTDFVMVADLIIILGLLLTKKIKLDPKPVVRKVAVAISSLGVLFFFVNLTLAEISRPQLLTRTFDRAYLVKYLGLDAYTVYDGLKTAKTNQARSDAESADLNKVLAFTTKHYAAPNPNLFGIAKGKNVIVIHLESFQQFLINYKLDGKEVTPFLNSLYNGNETYSFANFFNQVGQGKTSDAENMLETSTYGLPQGSLFTTLGSDNTFQAAPAILNQEANYSSAVFHGNVGSFWNRDNTYKNMGYQYFFDASYYNTNSNNLTEYGLKDKLLFHDSVKYLEKLQQPFYVKFITVSNHFPFELDKKNTSFKAANTGDSTVDNYFVTAHYLDQAVHEFFDYLKASGLYNNSIIVIYGDHYGISDSRNLKLAPLLGKSAATWSDYDDAQMQRVPFMIHIPGITNGGVQEQYGGEIDVLPTILHLLGIDSSKYIQFGTDLFSSQHDQVVAFRSGTFVTPNYTVVGSTIYQNGSGNVITHPSAKLKQKLQADKEKVRTELALSDTLNNKNLLRFYVPNGFTPVDPKNYEYKNQLSQLEKIQEILGNNSTSLLNQHNNQTTSSLYNSDAPELKTTDKSDSTSNSEASSDSATTSTSSSTQSSQN